MSVPYGSTPEGCQIYGFYSDPVLNDDSRLDLSAYKSYNIDVNLNREIRESIWDRQPLGQTNAKCLSSNKIHNNIPSTGRDWKINSQKSGLVSGKRKLTALKKHKPHKGTIFGTTKRFVENTSITPSPATYAPDIIKSSSINKKQRTPVPTFEWAGRKARFQYDKLAGSTLPPNLYHPKDLTGIDALTSKVVSRRGPYDLFTGPRDGTTMKNHFAFAVPQGSDAIYDLSVGLDIVNNPRKKMYGVFSTTERFSKKPTIKMLQQDISTCYKDDIPGPGSYDITWHTIKKGKRGKHPFNSSKNIPARPISINEVPGPGRYFLNFELTPVERAETEALDQRRKLIRKRKYRIRKKKVSWKTSQLTHSS